ncbi:MAG: DoxX family membrane protein [Armatimonadetes bacterium]|nr:DoxX family membrane protein [Armatimonadota bacterium]
MSRREILLVCSRAILSAVFLWAGLEKLHDPWTFAEQIAAYRVVPTSLVTLLAVALPCLEILVGACLAVGFLTTSCGLVVTVLTTTFAGAMASAVWRGLNIDCGCFSGASTVSWAHVAGDLVLAGMGLALLLSGPLTLSVDRWIAARR